jgi:hypothetical protein
MMHRSIRRATRCTSFFIPLSLTLSLGFTTAMTFAAAIGDQVELNTTHPAQSTSTQIPVANCLAPPGTADLCG